MQADKLSQVIKASGNTVESYWPSMFAKAIQGQNIEELLTSIATAGPAVALGAAAAGGPAAAAKGKILKVDYSQSKRKKSQSRKLTSTWAVSSEMTTEISSRFLILMSPSYLI